MRTGSKREGPGPDEVLGSLVLGFFAGLVGFLEDGSDAEVEADAADAGEGESGEATIEGTIDLSAGMTVEGSNEGSVAICLAIQVL